MSTELEVRARLSLRDFTLDVDERIPVHGVTGVFGESGSGKTTLLRILAGLEDRAAARIALSGEIWQDEGRFVPPHRRGTGFVFQEAALFPHLDVRANLLYGRQRQRGRVRVAALDFDQVVETLELAPLMARGTAALSGGERQRVALGRCLLSNPRLLLLDEPMSALGRRHRRALLPYLRAAIGLVRAPAVYVSHSVGELRKLADRVLLLDAGQVTARGGLDLLPGFEEIGLTVDLRKTEADRAIFDGGWVRGTGQRLRPGMRLSLRFAADRALIVPGAATGALAQLGLRCVVTGPTGTGRLQLRAGGHDFSLPLPEGAAGRIPEPGTEVDVVVAHLSSCEAVP